MKSQGSIKIRPDLLAEAVTAVVPSRKKPSRKRKPYPLSLVYFAEDKALGVKEAYHALRGYRVPATGHWPDKVQVNGVVLAAIVLKLAASSEIELVALDEELVILQGRSQIRMKRLDPGDNPGIVETAPRRDWRHTGPVVMPPDEPPTHRFEWNDTWLFSARVLFPQHRKSTGEAGETYVARPRKKLRPKTK